MNWITIIGTIFKPNICESADGHFKHFIYGAGNEVYGGFNYQKLI